MKNKEVMRQMVEIGYEKAKDKVHKRLSVLGEYHEPGKEPTPRQVSNAMQLATAYITVYGEQCGVRNEQWVAGKYENMKKYVLVTDERIAECDRFMEGWG